jgi:hypothetical protein
MTDEIREQALDQPLVQAIDAYFEARERFGRALITADLDAMVAAARAERDALGTWLAQLINLIDGRTASLLAETLTRLLIVEQALGLAHRPQPEDPPG